MKSWALGALMLCLGIKGVHGAEESYLTLWAGGVQGRTLEQKLQINGAFSGMAKAEPKDGVVVGVASGYEFFYGLRGELEGAVRYHELESFLPDGDFTTLLDAQITAGGGTPPNWADFATLAQSDVIVGTGMMNVYVDLVHGHPFLVPFLGAGVGLGYFKANVEREIVGIKEALDSNNYKPTLSDRQYCWQIMGGIHFFDDCLGRASARVRWMEVWPDFRFALGDVLLESSFTSASLEGALELRF